MAYGLSQSDDPIMAQKIEAADVIGIGPGLGQDEWARSCLKSVLSGAHKLVLDADALNLLSQVELEPSDEQRPWVLTPHVGEAARLLGIEKEAVLEDSFKAASDIAEKYNCAVVIKGPGNVIATPDGQVRVIPTGNPGMASAGMGDILTGVICALAAQGWPLVEALTLGVCIHGESGNAAAKRGEIGMLAKDVIAHLRGMINGIGV